MIDLNKSRAMDIKIAFLYTIIEEKQKDWLIYYGNKIQKLF